MRQSLLIPSAIVVTALLVQPLFAQTPPAAAPVPPTPAVTPSPAPKKVTRPVVTIETTKGTIVIELRPDDAPKTAANFATLVKKGFYDGLKFHRVEPGFVIQTGDPNGDGTGGPGYTIPDEQNKVLTHEVGAVAMAKSSAPNSAGSQFYIVIGKPAHFLDHNYTVFGNVLSGQDVAEKIVVGDKMIKVTIVEPDAAPAPATGTAAATAAPVPAVVKVTSAASPKSFAPFSIPYLDDAQPVKSSTAKVKLTIDADGRVSKVDIKQGTGVEGLDSALKDWFAKWPWNPALKDGVAVKSDRTIIYNLERSSWKYE